MLVKRPELFLYTLDPLPIDALYNVMVIIMHIAPGRGQTNPCVQIVLGQ